MYRIFPTTLVLTPPWSSFLHGHHILDTAFGIDGNISSALIFTAYEPDKATQVTCTRNGTYNFANIDSLMFSDLDIRCGGTYGQIYADTLTYFWVRSCVICVSSLVVYTANMVSFTRSKFMPPELSHDSAGLTLVEVNATFNNCTISNMSLIYVAHGSVIMSGTNVIANNDASITGALIIAISANICLCGSTKFANNTGGTPLTVSGSQLSLEGEMVFEDNDGPYGGAITASSSILNFTGNTTFTNNRAIYGGAVYAASSSLYFFENSTTVFNNNTATNGDGGAVFLGIGSKLIFLGLVTVLFQGNVANRGGALYVQDSNPLTYCIEDEYDLDIALEDCFYTRHGNYTVMCFESNKANKAGSGLYGGAIDVCTDFSEAVYISDDPMEISSDPYIVCACNSTGPDCSQPSISLRVFPGGSITVALIALGQRHGPTPATILATHDTQIEIGEPESAHLINNTCTNLSYSIFGMPGNGALQLYAEGPCLDLGTNLTVEIEVNKCPSGFKLIKANGTCKCDDRLRKYTDACNITDQTVTRDGAFWVGYDQDLDDVILYPNCPFDYCVTRPVSFVLKDYTKQCRYNRAGLLCGGCREGLSLLLGSSQCGKCSNSHLGLLVVFAVTGVLLVVFVLTFNLTVAVGTINGLIFYANVVGSNQAIFFPKESTTYLDVLKVFIAWINLDFGIESCFYNGMDAYHRAWLQYAFPTYIWSLIVLVFVVSHFSQRASRILGSNPVAVLATLILLSYTKVLRTITEVLDAASLEYPYGQTKSVWIYDGNVPFFGGKHLVLFVFSILVLTFLFIPYSLLLLTSQWLQIKSHWKILSWLNKPQLRAFLDAYHAPYKPRHRYWTGLLLLARFAILLMSALNTDSNPAVNLLVVFIFVLVVLAWQWVCGGVYSNWCLELLDSFFLLNIVFLVQATYYINYEPSSSQFLFQSGERSQEAGTATLVTISLVVFVGIVTYHGYLRVRRTATWKTAVRKITKHNNLEEKQRISAAEEDSGLLPLQAPTKSYVTIPQL